MAKRMNGEGSWSKRTINGKEYYSFRKSYPEGRKEFTGKTKKEVDQKVKKFEADRKSKAPVVSVEYFADYALDYVNKVASKNIGTTTLENYVTAINSRVKPPEYEIGQLQLNQLTKYAMSRYVEKLVEKKYSRATIVKTMRVVRHAIEHGIKEGKISKDVLEDFNPPTEKRVLTKEKDIPFLDKEDMDKLYTEAKKERYSNNGYAIILIMYTGMRAGEMQELRWKDVDFENKTISISRTAIKIKSKNGYKLQTKNSPKSEASKRTIPLCKQSTEALKFFEAQNPKHKKNDFVCVNAAGEQFDQSNLRRALKSMLKNADCSVEKCGLHALRHSFGSRLLEEGVDIKVVSVLMGHEKITTTYDHYIHILNKRIATSVAIFDND